MAKRNKQAWEINTGVAFKGVSFGAKTARIGVSISRERLEDLGRADELFVDRRLSGTIVMGHENDDPKQLDLLDVAHKVTGVFDVKGFTVKAESLEIGLTFGRLEIDAGELSLFASKDGRLIVTSSEEIPAGGGTEPDGPEAQQLFSGQEPDGDEEFAEDGAEPAHA